MVIDALENAEDYAAFEMAVTADYDAQTAVERELVLRLASVLWRLRRATVIESGLFKIQARHLLQYRQAQRAHQQRQQVIDNLHSDSVATDPAQRVETDTDHGRNFDAPSPRAGADQLDDLTRSYIRLTNLPAFPLDRLNRYEATLWRQACQILFTLGFLKRGTRRTGMRFRRKARLAL